MKYNKDYIWVSSDWHFKFKWMMKARKDHNLFTSTFSTNAFEQLIIDNWNKHVQDDDIAIFLGDLTFDNKWYGKDFSKQRSSAREAYKDYMRAFEIVKTLNGKIIWIFGNHDRPFLKGLKRGKLDNFISSDEKNAFLNSLNEAFANIEENPFQINNKVFSHEPAINLAKGLLNYHGHIHLGTTASILAKSKSHINVNVECTDFAPVKVSLD